MFSAHPIGKPAQRWANSPLLLLVLTGILLGATLPVARAAGEAGWSSLAFTFWTALGSGLVLLLTGINFGHVSTGLVRYSLIAGTLSVAIPNTLVFVVLPLLGTTLTSLAYMLPSLLTYGFGLLLGMEQFRPARLAGVLLGLSGVALLIAGSPITQAPMLTSLLLALCIPLSIACGNLYRKRYLPQTVAARTLASGMLLAGALALLPSLLSGAPLLSSGLDWRFVLLQCFFTSTGYLVYFRFQKVADPVYFSQLGYVMSATGILFGVVLFGEKLTLWMPLALIVIIVGVRLVNRLPASPQT